MAHVDAEIRTQPTLWRRVAQEAGMHTSALPVEGARVGFVGCGTSWHTASAIAARREELGLGESDASTAMEFAHQRQYDHVVAITRSGSTSEIVSLLQSLRGRVRTTVVTASPDSVVTTLANSVVVLPWADEQSVVVTRFATTVVALLLAHFGESLEPAAADAEELLELSIESWLDVDQVAFLGSGWTVGLANEAALKAREAAQFWAEAHPAMDYRHGPISIAQPGRLVVCLGEVPSGLEGEVRARGALWWSSDHDPLAQLVLAQRFAASLASRRGLDPDQPRGLSRAVVLA